MNFGNNKPVEKPIAAPTQSAPKPKIALTTQERIKRAQAVNLAVQELSIKNQPLDEVVLEARYDFYKSFLDKVLEEK